jgi:predicted transcriptional regulator
MRAQIARQPGACAREFRELGIASQTARILLKMLNFSM